MTDLLAHPTKIVLTGGTAGIGKAMCECLLAAGHQVIVIARRAGSMSRAPHLHPIGCDLADPDAVRTAVAQIAREHPEVTIVINNAALQYGRALTDPDFDAGRLEEEVSINLLAPALIAHGLLATLRAHGKPGAIVNVNSGLAIFPKQESALYCATKAGLHSFSQSLRYQLEGTAIHVLEAFLPLVDTGMTQGRGSGKLSAETAADAILAGIRHGRDRHWIGKARLVPALARLAPGLGSALLRGPR